MPKGRSMPYDSQKGYPYTPALRQQDLNLVDSQIHTHNSATKIIPTEGQLQHKCSPNVNTVSIIKSTDNTNFFEAGQNAFYLVWQISGCQYCNSTVQALIPILPGMTTSPTQTARSGAENYLRLDSSHKPDHYVADPPQIATGGT
ncbi:hypothetical protein EDC04DRAFT_2604213 [Pisolithus marmoratus]|nr:hypothetical protein EDC04DRAFT_2604213 [Pisolithus marmoratus]